MARRKHPNQARGFALIFAAVLSAALALIVSAITTTSGMMQRQAVAVNQSTQARALAEQGLARALADLRTITALRNQLDYDLILDPNGTDSGACSQDNCTGVDPDGEDFLPLTAVYPGTAGSVSYAYGGWGSGFEDFNGNRYRKVTVGNNAYMVRYDDNHDDSVAGLEETTNNTNSVQEGTGADVRNRDRDQHIYVTAIGMYGGTSMSNARARHVLRASIRTLGGRAVRAGSFADVGGGICGNNGPQVCDSTPTPACWCGELQYDPARGAPSAINTCAAGVCPNCETATAAPVTGLCGILTPPALTDITTHVQRRSTYANLVNGTATQQCLFRVDDNVTISIGGGETRSDIYIIHMWDPGADATCASTSGNLPAPDFNFGAWNLPADCWVPVHIRDENTAFCLADAVSPSDRGWITADCRQSWDHRSNETNDQYCQGTAPATSGTNNGAKTWCPGRYFNGKINALDSITSSTSGGHYGVEVWGHKPIVGVRAANTNSTTGLGRSGHLEYAKSGRTSETWSARCGCVSCGDGNNLQLDFVGSNLTLHAEGPRGVFLFDDRGGSTVNLAVTSGATAASSSNYSQQAFVFRGRANVVIPEGQYLQNISGDYALMTEGDCTISANFGAKKGIWCGGNVTVGADPGKIMFGDIVAGDDNLKGNIDMAGNNFNNWKFCSSNITTCPATPADCNLTPQRANFWANGNILIGGNGGGTGPDVCANMRAANDVVIPANAAGAHLSGSVWSGGNLVTGNNNEVRPPNNTLLGATPSLMSVQSFSF